MKKPKTVKEARLLPIVHPWETEIIAEYIAPDDIMVFEDADGEWWRIVKTKDGYGRMG